MRKKHITLFSSLLVALLVFSSCSQGSNETYESADQMVTSALSEVQTISMQDLEHILVKKELVVVVDCREEEDYKNGHITGSVNVPRGLLEFSPKLSNRRIRTIVIGNAEGSGALAVKTLGKMKYSDCYLLDCTIEEWAKAYPEWVEKGVTKTDIPLKEVKAPEGC